MAYSEAGKRAVPKYIKNNYDNVTLRAPKRRKAELHAHAAEQGESLNGFIVRAVDEPIERGNERVK